MGDQEILVEELNWVTVRNLAMTIFVPMRQRIIHFRIQHPGFVSCNVLCKLHSKRSEVKITLQA